MTRLIQIVPNLPPSLNGVGDFALHLAVALREQHAIETLFLVASPDWSGPDEVEGFTAVRIDRDRFPSVLLLRNESAPPAVLLHYVGYGYAKRGAPLWLIRWLRSMLQTRPKPMLLTFFHELYVFAFGPNAILTSSFWLAPLQRHVCRHVAKLSDWRVTNKGESASILRQMAGDTLNRTLVFPVFSNFGEPPVVPELLDRKPQMVVYGDLCRSPGDIGFAGSQLRELAKNLGIERVISFGPRKLQPFAPDLPVENRGILPAGEISELLLQSRAGYIDYPMSCLGKSTIFASYCAHGMVPVLLRADCAEAEGLHEGVNLLTAERPAAASEADSQQKIASAARLWYQGHSVAVLAQAIAGTMPVAEPCVSSVE